MNTKRSRHTFEGARRIMIAADNPHGLGGFVVLRITHDDGTETAIDIATTADFLAPKPVDLSAAQTPVMEAAQ